MVMNSDSRTQRVLLQNIAQKAMLERGLLPEFPAGVLAELDRIQASKTADSEPLHDLRKLLWASIDNDDSRDLDQLTVAEMMPEGKVKIRVAVADVDSLVKKGSAIDDHASHNTTSVYTAAQIFPMLPEKLSTDLTSLNFNQDRQAIIIEMVINSDGSIQESNVYQAVVRNHAKLAYTSVAAWLDGNSAMPEAIATVNGLAENLQMQDKIAQGMKNFRHTKGALTLETIQAKPIFDGDQVSTLEIEEKNRAKELIEEFMVAANSVTALYLSSKNFPSIRRVVRTPKRWERIVEIAAEHGVKLPANPDSKALEDFLTKQKTADTIRFPDLSLAVIKLLGAGEYVAEFPHATATGHFGLAVKDYSHSTAPNRRYADLITQRLLKAAMNRKPVPYSKDELEHLAAHCTQQEDAANKVERQVAKSAAALLLQSRIGEQFESIVTGASSKGTWVRLLDVPVEGKLVHGFEGLDVGDSIRVQLLATDVEHGFIDFSKVVKSQ
ncbi:MAG: RNB domain-containing ribonuclease [Anaerolineae bacterium]|nr:RNB domain-containing ribonuclease [Anaerolineae bacterium]